MSHADDRFVGRILSRREVVKRFGVAGLLFLGGCSSKSSSGSGSSGSSSSTGSSGTSTSTTSSSSGTTTSVVATPALTEGPFFVDEGLNRSDLIAGTTRSAVRNGTPFRLNVRVWSLVTGTPTLLTGAQVDLWHADGSGVYSDEPSSGIQSEDTRGQTWLRGYQLTDASGLAGFDTIWPGWYVGRTIHLHFKVRTFGSSGALATTFTSQLFVDDALNDVIMASGVYATRGTRTVRNANDSIYQARGTDNLAVGTHLLLAPATSGSGYAATFDVGLTQI